jgi:hypothetical protein
MRKCEREDSIIGVGVSGDASTLLLEESDTETRFMLRAKRGAGKKERGHELLAKASRIGN